MTREKAIEVLDKMPLCNECDATFPFHCNECEEAFLLAIEALKQPETIRCKDCKHSVPSSENFVVCTAPYSQLVHTTYKPIDWYCPKGERKDGDVI